MKLKWFRRFTQVRTISMALLVTALLASVPSAFAHAVLQKSEPAAGATVSGAKAASLPIVLTFNSRIDAAHSMLSLVAAPGAKPVTLPANQKAEPNVLRSVAAGLKAGHYQLRWQVVASDGHMSRGVVPFDVR